MTPVVSILAPAVTCIALAMEPPQAPWLVAADIAGLPEAPATPERCGFAAPGIELPHVAPGDETSLDELTPSDALRWALTFAGLAAIATVRRPRP